MTATTPEVASPAPTGKGTGRKRWFALGFMSLGVSMVMIDATIINVAIPAISADLDLTPTDIEWVNSIYSLVFASLLITMGKAGDVVGRRLIFAIGATVFLASSLIAALAQSGEMLVAGRFLQGIGGAMMIPASLSLLNSIFRGRDRAIAFAVWGATIGCVAAIGPLLGGFIITHWSWRWAFAINLPIAIALVIGLLLLVPESKDPNAQRGVDVVGVLTSSIGLGALIFALIEGQRFGWVQTLGDPSLWGINWSLAISPALFAFLLGLVLLTTFVLVERRRAETGKVVLLDLTLFRIRSFVVGQGVGMLIMFGEFGILLMLPLFLQNVLGFSALHAGATLAFIMVGALISTPPSGRLVQRIGALSVVRIGLVLETVAMVGLGFAYGVDTSTWAYAPWLLVFGMGVGLATAQITNVILRDVPVEKGGQASGTQSATRQLGVALGIAVLGAVLWLSLGNILDQRLQNADVPPQIANSVTDNVVDSSGIALAPLRAADAKVGAIADEAYSDATARSTWVAAGFMLAGFALTFLMTPQSREAARRQDEAEDAAAGPEPEDAAAGPEPEDAEPTGDDEPSSVPAI